MPSRFRFARHPLDGTANPTPAHRQSKAVFQNGSGIGMRQSQRFVHQHTQCHSLRTHLYRSRSQGIGSLQWVAALYPLTAPLTPADRNVEAPYLRATYNLFLVLRFHSLHRQRSAAFRTLCRSVHMDLLVYVVGDRSLIMAAMRSPGFAARRSGITLGLAARERSGLALGGALRRFQLLAQPFHLVFQPLLFFLQPL